MSDKDKAQQTEEATPRKKEKLREEGQVAKSADVGSAAMVLAVSATLALIGQGAAQSVFSFAHRAFTFRDAASPKLGVLALMHPLLSAVLPVLLAATVIGAVAGLVQTRGLFKLSLLSIKPDRLNPFPQLKKIVPGKESGIELFKQLLKMAAIAAVVASVVHGSFSLFVGLASSEPVTGARAVVGIVGKTATYGALAFAAVAAFDYWLARRKFLEDAKMSKQDVKDERKQEEGDPLVRMQRRRRARELAMSRSLGDVRNATVLVANPTHVSIALRYEPEQDAAPMMLAKGLDDHAMQMRKTARQHGVPIVENKPLARSLYRDGKVGAPIPVEFYGASAQVIAHVLGLRQRGAASTPRASATNEHPSGRS